MKKHTTFGEQQVETVMRMNWFLILRKLRLVKRWKGRRKQLFKHVVIGGNALWSLRAKTLLIILSICFVIIAISMSAGFLLSQRNLVAAIQDNMTVANALATEMVAGKLAELDSRIKVVTEQIARMDFAEIRQLLDSYVKNNTYLSMRVFYRDGRVICSGDDFFSIDANAEQAFRGETVIGSPLWNGVENFVLRIYKPVDQNRILAITFPGQYISSMISSYSVWNTGTLFILDSKGTLIGSTWENRVFNSVNYIENARYFSEYQGIADLSLRMIRGETGMARYLLGDQERITLFRPIPNSGGWSLGVAYPIDESPIAVVRKSFMETAAMMLFLGFLAAIICAGFIAKPYDRITILKMINGIV